MRPGADRRCEVSGRAGGRTVSAFRTSSASPRPTCATTPACACRRTGVPWPGCSMTSSSAGRWGWRSSCSSDTRWAAWSLAAPVTTGRCRQGAGPTRCATCSAWARRTSVPTWRGAPTCSGGRWHDCPRRARWPTCSTRAASASRTCALARAWRRTGVTVNRTSSCATAAARSRSWPTPTTTSSARGWAADRSARCSATCSSACPARRGAATAGDAASPSRSTTATSSPV